MTGCGGDYRGGDNNEGIGGSLHSKYTNHQHLYELLSVTKKLLLLQTRVYLIAQNNIGRRVRPYQHQEL